jgi:hypothetical protein
MGDQKQRRFKGKTPGRELLTDHRHAHGRPLLNQVASNLCQGEIDPLHFLAHGIAGCVVAEHDLKVVLQTCYGDRGMEIYPALGYPTLSKGCDTLG